MVKNIKEGYISLEQYLGIHYWDLTPEEIVSGMLKAKSENRLVYWQVPKDIVLYSDKTTKEDLYEQMFGMSSDRYEYMKNNEPGALCKEVFKMSLDERKYYIENRMKVEDKICNIIERTGCFGKIWKYHSNGNEYTWHFQSFYTNVIVLYCSMVKLWPQALRALDCLFEIVNRLYFIKRQELINIQKRKNPSLTDEELNFVVDSLIKYDTSSSINLPEYMANDEFVIKFKKFDDQTKKNIEKIIRSYFKFEYVNKLLSVLGYDELDDQKNHKCKEKKG